MLVLGIYGSPRRGGNSDLLLDRCLEGARAAGLETATLRASDLKISGCQACGWCEQTGECRIQDDMQKVYPLLDGAERIVLASPIFFYSFPAQLKALIDRAQARWSRRLLSEKYPQPTSPERLGFLIAVGATRGKNLFEGAQLTARYFYEALGVKYAGGLFFRRLDKKAAVCEHQEYLEQAFQLGQKIALPGELQSSQEFRSPQR